MTLLNKITSPFQEGDKNKIVGVVEPIQIRRGDNTEEEDILAAVNCAVEHSQIDKKFAQELGLYSNELVVDRIPAVLEGKERLVEQVEVTFSLGDETKTSRWLVTDRADEKQMIVLGKNDLRGYLVKIPE